MLLDGHSANSELSVYIVYYNLERRHSSLGQVAPHEFETNSQVRN